MFRRNPFTKGPHPNSTTENSLQPVIPEDEQVPSTPIPERPALFTSNSLQDPGEPKSASWTSQAAAYDINPKYTTANQSYTHRRRKSSVITNLIAGANDPYQPTYQDWREGVASPESLRPRSKSWSLFGRRKNRNFGMKCRCGKVARLVTALFILISVVLSGLWLFGGPMPLLTVDDLKALDWKLNPSGVQWGNWQIDPKLMEKARLREKWTQMKRWMPSPTRRDDDNMDTDDASLINQASQLAGVISIDFDPELLQSFGVSTLERVTRKSSPTATSSLALSTDALVTLLGDSLSSNDIASSSQLADTPATEESGDAEIENAETEAHRKRAQAMWKKYAQSSEENTISLAGTIANGVSLSTESSAS